MVFDDILERFEPFVIRPTGPFGIWRWYVEISMPIRPVIGDPRSLDPRLTDWYSFPWWELTILTLMTYFDIHTFDDSQVTWTHSTRYDTFRLFPWPTIHSGDLTFIRWPHLFSPAPRHCWGPAPIIQYCYCDMSRWCPRRDRLILTRRPFIPLFEFPPFGIWYLMTVTTVPTWWQNYSIDWLLWPMGVDDQGRPVRHRYWYSLSIQSPIHSIIVSIDPGDSRFHWRLMLSLLIHLFDDIVVVGICYLFVDYSFVNWCCYSILIVVDPIETTWHWLIGIVDGESGIQWLFLDKSHLLLFIPYLLLSVTLLMVFLYWLVLIGIGIHCWSSILLIAWPIDTMLLMTDQLRWAVIPIGRGICCYCPDSLLLLIGIWRYSVRCCDWSIIVILLFDDPLLFDDDIWYWWNPSSIEMLWPVLSTSLSILSLFHLTDLHCVIGIDDSIWW